MNARDRYLKPGTKEDYRTYQRIRKNSIKLVKYKTMTGIEEIMRELEEHSKNNENFIEL